uniref:carotenoid oxygenase family protein n=1 Tax=Candidatus Entotheonella palauensis TaxID=93172 RepID=UPI0015C4A7E1
MADATINLNRLRIAQRNTELTSPDGTLPPDAPDWIWEVDNPYLHGPYAPIKTEMTVDELEVIGDLPADLCGAYIRNSPVPVHKPVNRYHAYDGDGMLQGVYFRDGKASYANKWIRTKALLKEQEAGASIWPGIMGPFDFSLPYFPIKDSSNTDIIYYNGTDSIGLRGNALSLPRYAC